MVIIPLLLIISVLFLIRELYSAFTEAERDVTPIKEQGYATQTTKAGGKVEYTDQAGTIEWKVDYLPDGKFKTKEI